MRDAILALILLAGAAGTTAASAKEYNKRPFLDSGKQSKVENAISGGMLLRGQGEATASRFNTVAKTDCGKLEVGRAQAAKPGQAPRDNIVVTGDVINVAQNCGVQR